MSKKSIDWDRVREITSRSFTRGPEWVSEDDFAYLVKAFSEDKAKYMFESEEVRKAERTKLTQF